MDDEITGNTPEGVDSGLIMAGPDDSIFDDIFDWIANGVSAVVRTVTDWIGWAVSSIGRTITDWISWAVTQVTGWFNTVWGWIQEATGTITSWVSSVINSVLTTLSSMWSGITSTIGAWFGEQWSRIQDLITRVQENLLISFQPLPALISGYFTGLTSQLESWFTWLGNFVRDQVVAPLDTWWDRFLDRLFTPAEWIDQLLDGVWAWFQEDVPGHSPRWTAIFEDIGDWFLKWFVRFPSWMAENFPERVAYGLSESFRWVGDMFNEVFETFTDAILGLVRMIGPMTPSNAMAGYSGIAKVGLMALGGLAGMTIAGEFLNPLSHLGLGHVSAMIYDMTNYKLITGVFMGALTATMLRTPLTYYFNDIFRPWLLRPGDFMELMSREAFTEPEKLRVPELTAAMQAVAPGGGAGFESAMVGWYGYPSAYLGFFKELANTRLGYFALAGIARAGFWDEPWFIEALSRTGYSPTARAALLLMYRELVTATRQGIVLGQLRRQLREGYLELAELRETLDQVTAMDNLDDIRIMAMELEQDTALKDMAVDIHLSAFTRGVIPESECIKNLRGIIKSTELIDLQMMRTKLGLLRRLSIAVEEPVVAPFQIVEE